MEATQVQKYLLKNKTMAKFDRFDDGKLFYNIDFEDGYYQFPIDLVEDVFVSGGTNDFGDELGGFRQALKSDVKGAAFVIDMRGSELFRWIKKAIDKGNMMKTSL